MKPTKMAALSYDSSLFTHSQQMSRLTKRQQQAIDTRNLIYETAMKLMEQDGFERLTISKVAKQAGLSVGAFYHYFSSKDDLLGELFTRGDEFFARRVANNIKGLRATEQLVSYFDHYAEFYMLNGVDIIKSLYRTQDKLFVKNDRVIVRLVHDIVSRGIAAGELTAEMTADEMVEFLFLGARGLVFKWCVEDGGFPLDEAMHRYINRLLKALIPSR